MAKDRENMGGPTQGAKDPPTADRNNDKQPSGMRAQSQSSPIGDEERSNRDRDPLSDHGVSRVVQPDEQDAGIAAVSSAEMPQPIDVRVNTDSSIEGSEALAAKVQATVSSALARFADRITRVEVHLSDQNRDKGGRDDKRCMIEARLQGLEPIAVTDTAGTVVQAVDGAAGKMRRSIETTLGKRGDRRPGPDPGEIAPDLPSTSE